MRHFNTVAVVIFIVGLIGTMVANRYYFNTDTAHEKVIDDYLEYLGEGRDLLEPMPEKIELNEQKVELGKKLFSDRSLSPKQFSCTTCHQLDNSGIDGLALSVTTDGGHDVMNTPTIYNVALNGFFGWTGSLLSLEAQIDDVINNRLHMASSWDHVLSTVRGNKEYVAAFKKLYDAEISIQTVTNAIVSFERSLLTINSPYDRYLRGDETAINEDAKAGLSLFNSYGCVSCHQGVNLGGNLRVKMGVMNDSFNRENDHNAFDKGLYSVTFNDEDRYVFRVPSLRNVSSTSPYFHNGSVTSLAGAVKIMAKSQLGRDLPSEDIKMIVRFLETLSDLPQEKTL